MSGATRGVPSDALVMRRMNTMTFTRYGVCVILLVVLLFASAFGIVYTKDLNRRLLIEAQLLERENSLENERWGKLLLARGILARESRVHHLAEKRLHMLAPNPREISVVRLGDGTTQHG